MGHITVRNSKAGALSFVLGLATVLSWTPSSAADVFVAGPVESLLVSKGEAVVLGQTVRLNPKQMSRLRTMTSHQTFAGFQAYVEVAGIDGEGGVIVARSIQGGTPYVAGSSAVAVRNFVTKATDSRGYLTVGGLKIDVAALRVGVQAGDLIEVAGTQPSVGGIAIASVFKQVISEIGSGKDGVIGSGKDGVIGSGKDGVIGSGKDGVIGSGKDGVIGSGKDGVIGSGKDGVIGSGKDGVIGSGKDGVIGSGKDGVIGSGKDGVIGSGAM